jgi:hypothetical protein
LRALRRGRFVSGFAEETVGPANASATRADRRRPAAAAHRYRSVLFLTVEVEPKILQLLVKHEDLLKISDTVINAWRQQLGLDGEEAVDGSA